jgi:hypothetical protein
MNYKRVLIAIAFAFGGTVSAAPNETFEGASQAGSRYFSHDPLGLVDYGNGNVRYTASWAGGARFVAVMRYGQPGLGQPGLGQPDLGHFNLGQPNLEVHNITAPVPEPETYALMMAGLFVVSFVAKRRAARRSR